MKKFLSLIAFVLLSYFSFAQKVINPKGILSDDFHFVVDSVSGTFRIDSCNYFYVVPFKGKTAHELYADVLARIAHMFENPSFVTQKVEDKTIVVNSRRDGIVRFIEAVDIPDANIHSKWSVQLSIDYRLEFNFKDGKIRINPPTFTNITEWNMSVGSRHDHHGMSYLRTVYKNDYDAIRTIESYFNNIIPTFLFDIPNDSDW